MGKLFGDVRYAARALLARPGFALIAVLTLALGIGANTAIFSVIHGLLLSPLPFADGDRLVQVYNTYPKMGLEFAGTSIPDYLDRKEQAEALEDLFIYTGNSFNLADSGTPQHVQGLLASPSMFSTLQVAPALGRGFGEAEAQVGRDRVAVISHGLWEGRFGASPTVIGRSIRLNGEAFQVIGVMPPDFAFPNVNTSVWVPFAFTDDQRSDNERGNEFSNSIGRLKPGATVEQLNAQMDAIVRRNLDRVAGTEQGTQAAAFFERSGFTGRARPLRAQWLDNLPQTLTLLQGVVAFVLLIACANVANLQLARLSGRGRELAVRAAMGAGIGRIARMLLTEAILLALAGGLFGLLIAWSGILLMDWLGLGLAARGMEVELDGTVLGFALLVSAAAGLLCGLVPLLSLLRGRLFEGLRDGGRSGGGSRAGALRAVLIVAQTALAVALLVGAGLMLRSFAALMDVDPGFQPQGVISARMSLPDARYPDAAAQAAFHARVLEKVGAVPGVEQAALSSAQPFGGFGGTRSYAPEGLDLSAGGEAPHTNWRVVSEDYFDALGIRLLRGRAFGAGDHADAPAVAIVDSVMVEKFFPDGHAVGKRIAFDLTPDADTQWLTIVGVVAPVRLFDLSTPVSKETVYVPFRQVGLGEADLIVKTSLAPASLVEPIRRAVLAVDPEMPLFDMLTLEQRISNVLAGPRAPMVLLATFAAVALLLAVIGLYGVLAFTVSQRRRELGVRMALGADRRHVQRLVLRQGAVLAALGLGAGVALALLLGRFIATQLHGVATSDLPTLTGVVVLLAATSLLASYIPARRASAVDPLVALRYE